MANTIDWGQGAVNNTNNWGKGKTNATNNWGAIYDSTAAGETNITGSGGVTPFTNTYSMSFDGVDEYFTAGNPSSLQITGALTLSAWVKTTNTTTAGMIIGKDGVSSGTRSYILNLTSTGESTFYVFKSTGTQFVQSTSQINDGLWHHVMAVNNGADLKIYIDGILENTNIGGGGTMLNGTSYFAIGRRQANAPQNILWFYGNIDEVAVWNTDQSSNVSTIYNSGTPTDLTSLSPVSWWRMGDGDTWGGSSWTLTDNSSGGNDATSVNMEEADRLPISPNSYTQNSFLFDGIDEYFNLATRTQNFTDFSLSFWVVWGGGNYKTIVGSSVAEGGILTAIVQAGGTIRYYDNTSGWTILSNSISDGNWHHILITYDSTANTLKGYTDGSLSVTKTSVDPVNTTNAHSFDQIGARLSVGVYNEKLSEITVWDSVIDIADVWDGSGIPIDLTSTNPIHNWRMGENATWNGSTWTLIDQGSGGNNATSVNMEEADKTGDQAYVL